MTFTIQASDKVAGGPLKLTDIKGLKGIKTRNVLLFPLFRNLQVHVVEQFDIITKANMNLKKARCFYPLHELCYCHETSRSIARACSVSVGS